MQDTFTFGWEAEFETNVPLLVERLSDAGLCGSRVMHSYHCRCPEACDFENGFAFRAQTDSSTGGEIISGVMRDMDDATEAMAQLQAIAVDVDAEPSLSAGVHVHVGVPDDWSDRQRHEYVWSYLRWEPVLGELVAPGRWPRIRDMNVPARRALRVCNLYDWLRGSPTADLVEGVQPWQNRGRGYRRGDFDPLWVEDTLDSATALRVCKQAAHNVLYDCDRHGWLNLSTRNTRTFEFRLWNSTRVAWRMELFARISLLFVNPEAVGDLQQRGQDIDQANLLRIAGRHDSRLKSLLRRQLNAPKTFDPFSTLGAPQVDVAECFNPMSVDPQPIPRDEAFLPPSYLWEDDDEPEPALTPWVCGDPLCDEPDCRRERQRSIREALERSVIARPAPVVSRYDFVATTNTS